jgi:hypothetical protein
VWGPEFKLQYLKKKLLRNYLGFNLGFVEDKRFLVCKEFSLDNTPSPCHCTDFMKSRLFFPTINFELFH